MAVPDWLPVATAAVAALPPLYVFHLGDRRRARENRQRELRSVVKDLITEPLMVLAETGLWATKVGRSEAWTRPFTIRDRMRGELLARYEVIGAAKSSFDLLVSRSAKPELCTAVDTLLERTSDYVTVVTELKTPAPDDLEAARSALSAARVAVLERVERDLPRAIH